MKANFTLMATAVSACLLSGCSSVNEGMSDIRRLRLSPDKTQSWALQANANEPAILPGQVVSISIDRLFVSEFDELNLNPGEVLTGNNPFVAQGEIALLAAAQQGSTPIADVSFDDHVVIYYSGDAREGQFANIRNQRVFGPSVVDGQFLSLEFVVLEVDRPTDQDGALFKKLADLGKGLAGISAGPTFAVLADLGSALLSAPNDDLQTKFRFTFDLGARPGARFPLVPGLYALVREDDRGYKAGTGQTEIRGETRWDEICLDVPTGELHVKSNGACTPTRYLRNSYLVINVEAALAAETQANQTYAAFAEQLSNVQRPSTAAFVDSVTTLAATYMANERNSHMTTSLARLGVLADQYGRAHAEVACDATKSAEFEAAEIALTEHTVLLHRLIIQEASTMTDADTVNDFDRSAYQNHMTSLARFFGQLDWGASGDPMQTSVMLLSQAGDPAKFESVFGDLSSFAAHVKAQASSSWPEGCGDTV